MSANPLGIYLHLVSDGTSHIFIHLHNSQQCRTICSDEGFSILDHASTTLQLKIKETIIRNFPCNCIHWSVSIDCGVKVLLRYTL